MNKFEPSKLQNYIKKDGFFVEKHPTSNLFIYGYSNNHNVNWNEENKHLRGLILDDKGYVISRSFPKFFSFKSYLSPNKILMSNNEIVDIPTSDFKILEKIDGSLGILYWLNNKPYIASQRSFTSKKARIATELLYKNYKHSFSLFKKDRTYLFEVVSPDTKVIVNYKEQNILYLIGVIDNETGSSLPLEDVGMPIVRDFTSDFSFVKNFTDLQNLNIPDIEGFVIVFGNGTRFKLKFPWYSNMHRLLDHLMYLDRTRYTICQKLKTSFNLDFNHISNKEIYLCLKNGESLDKILKNVPEIYYYYGFEEWVENIINKYQKQLNDIHDDTLPFNEEYFTISKNRNFDSVMLNFYKRFESKYD